MTIFGKIKLITLGKSFIKFYIVNQYEKWMDWMDWIEWIEWMDFLIECFCGVYLRWVRPVGARWGCKWVLAARHCGSIWRPSWRPTGLGRPRWDPWLWPGRASGSLGRARRVNAAARRIWSLGSGCRPSQCRDSGLRAPIVKGEESCRRLARKVSFGNSVELWCLATGKFTVIHWMKPFLSKFIAGEGKTCQKSKKNLIRCQKSLF